jgi:hypothetical protein
MLRKLLITLLLIAPPVFAQSNVQISLGVAYAGGSLTIQRLPAAGGFVETRHTFLGANGDTFINYLVPGSMYGFRAVTSGNTGQIYAELLVNGAPQDLSALLLSSASGQNIFTSINNRIFADTQAGADGCGQINTAWTKVTWTGGAIVDGNGFGALGTQNCSTNPYAGITKTGRTELAGVFATIAAWTLNQGMIVKGTGRGNSGSPTYGGTTIRAVAGFPSSTPVVTAGGYGARLEDLTIDCNNQTGVGAYANSAGQEQTGLKNILALNCPGTTFNLTTSGAQNSGVYQDLEALYQIAGSAAAGSLAFNINGLTPLREVSGLTVNATGQGTAPSVGVQITSVTNGIIKNIHCEGVTTCINVTSSNLIIENVQCTGATVVNCVVLGAGSQGVVLRNISGGTNTVVDNMNSITLTAAGGDGVVGWYQVGSSGAAPGQCSSSAHAPCNIFKAGTGATFWFFCTGTATASSTLTPFPFNSTAGTGCTVTTNLGGYSLSQPCTLGNLSVRAGTGGVAGDAVTVFNNGGATSISAVIGTGTSASDTTHFSAYTPPNNIRVVIVTGVATTLANVTGSFQCN